MESHFLIYVYSQFDSLLHNYFSWKLLVFSISLRLQHLKTLSSLVASSMPQQMIECEPTAIMSNIRYLSPSRTFQRQRVSSVVQRLNFLSRSAKLSFMNNNLQKSINIFLTSQRHHLIAQMNPLNAAQPQHHNYICQIFKKRSEPDVSSFSSVIVHIHIASLFYSDDIDKQLKYVPMIYISLLMSEQFTSPDNVCRKSLLQIVARGSALLAEMQRLHTFIPKIFLDPGKKYQNVLYTFEYFKQMDAYEDRIQKQSQLTDLNENIKSTYLPLLDRFFKLFEAICTYHEALNDFINEIQNGVFMQYSLENLFTFEEGKQLICEAFYYFGVMLLLMDQLIEGPVRERIIVCYYRNKGGENINNINKVMKLVSDTEYRTPERRGVNYVKPQNYPEDLFARYPFESDIVEAIILAIKDDDIYKQMPAYPQAKYRSFALANQSSMLFVLLFFMPDVLNRAKSTMRQIVDKHFYNAWVMPFYLGYIIDLTEWWKPYKAAKAALNNILDLEGIQDLTKSFVEKQAECYEKCNEYLTEGVMTDEYVTYNLLTMMNCLRDSNVTLKWLILHRKTSNDKLREIICQTSNDVGLLRLMLVTSEFQSLLKERIISLLQDKQNLWNQDRGTCSERLLELSDYFGKALSLGRLETDDSLQAWFKDMSQAVGNISYSNSTYATRKIHNFIKALEDIEEYQQVSSKIQVKTYLYDTRNDLNHMIKLVNIKKSTLTHIEIISDITWSWVVLKDYIKLMQKEIRKSPGIALLLKNTFMKLSSILNIPMVRLLQAESPDIESVSKFYSNQLIRLVKDVLQIIPELVFENLDNIITIFLTNMKNQPHKFDKAELPKYSQFQQRLQIAKLTNEISVFAESILNMETYLIGVIEVNPKEVLEAGIRKELIKLIAQILEKSLRQPARTPEEFFSKIVRLSEKLNSFKLSLEYIQDFIHIHGLKMFYQEFEKLIYAYVDIEKLFLITKEVGFQELNYDQSIPMPKGEYVNCNSFFGEILNEILMLTHPSRCTFLQAAYGFFNLETKREVLSLKTLHILSKCIGISGMQGLDYLLSMRIMEKLKLVVMALNKVCNEEGAKNMLHKAYASLKNMGSFSQRYENTLNMLKKSCRNLSDYLVSELTEVGQYILLRDMICLQLRMLGKIGSPRLHLVLCDLNEALLNDMVKNQFVPETEENHEQMINDNLILALASPYFAHMGLLDPMKKVFITSKHIESLPILLFTALSLQIFNMDYDNNLKCLIRTKKSQIEPNYFLVGCLCLLQQFHPTTKLQYFAYIANYIKSTINFIMINKQVSKNPELVADLFTYIRYLEECIKYSREPYEKYKEIIDLGLFSSLDRETLKSGYKLS